MVMQTIHSLPCVVNMKTPALGMIVVFFLVCQVLFLKLSFKRLKRIAVGVVITYIGLVLFLTGVNVGFMPIGYKLGHSLASASPEFLIGFGLVTGVLVVLAEPQPNPICSPQQPDFFGYAVLSKRYSNPATQYHVWHQS